MTTQRNILAALLIFGLFMLIPIYLDMIGITQASSTLSPDVIRAVEDEAVSLQAEILLIDEDYKNIQSSGLIEIITIETEYYRAEISNQGGGSIVRYELIASNDGVYRYLGSYDSSGKYNLDSSVVLIHSSGSNESKCAPCLVGNQSGSYIQYNQPFQRISSSDISNGILRVGPGEIREIKYVSDGIEKILIINGDSYEMTHQYIYDLKNSSDVEILWSAGLFPTEPSIHPSKSYSSDELTYSSAYAYQDGALESITQSSQANISENLFNKTTDWAAIRTKFFGAALIPNKKADYVKLSSKNFQFRGSDDILPLYSAAMGGYNPRGELSVTTYLGPLDVEYIDKLANDASVSSIMNFGWSIIKPFSRFVLWTIKSLHNVLGLNYGVVLIVVAVLMRFITGPLTRKSYESSSKMKLVAPLQKDIQEKYKNDPQKLQQEMGKLWKEHGVNPVSGCLPMLVQWPILMSFFIIFRSTIEFRGAPFIGWINDLSQPDYIFSLPFEIPLYGGAVAVLPILMGVSMFLTMRITMQSTDDTQKTFMYFMNAFFILIFNSFPSGLTLYYTIFNFLSYQQQLSIKNSK